MTVVISTLALKSHKTAQISLSGGAQIYKRSAQGTKGPQTRNEHHQGVRRLVRKLQSKSCQP